MELIKAVIMSLLVLGVVVGEIQAHVICCSESSPKDCFKDCGESDSCFETCKCFGFPDYSPCPIGFVNIYDDINAKPCCPQPARIECFKKCIGYGDNACCGNCGCVPKAPSDEECPPDMFGITAPGNGVSSYCKLGCKSSVCERITSGFKTVGVSGETEVKKAVQHCNSACSQMCNIKGSKLQLAAVA